MNLFRILFALAVFATCNAFAENGQKPSSLPKEPSKIIVEPDQTDIFAIPLDEDAEDQQEELYNLEHPKK